MMNDVRRIWRAFSDKILPQERLSCKTPGRRLAYDPAHWRMSPRTRQERRAPIQVYAGKYASSPLIATDTEGTAHLLINTSSANVQALYAAKPAGGAWGVLGPLSFAPLLQSVEQPSPRSLLPGEG